MHRDELRIESPCHEDWSAMTGDTRRRHCDACDTHVHDLSAMTEREARRLLARSPTACIRYRARPDGSVRHAPTRRLPRQRAVAAARLSAAPALGSSAPAPTPGPEPDGPSIVDWARQRVRAALGLAAEEPAAAPISPAPEPEPDPPAPPPPQEPIVLGRRAPPPTIRLPAAEE